MTLQHIVEHIVGRVEEGDGTKGKKQDEIILVNAGTQRPPQQIAQQKGTHHQLHPNHIKGNDILGKEQAQHGYTHTDSQQMGAELTIVAIYPHHSNGEEMDEQ